MPTGEVMKAQGIWAQVGIGALFGSAWGFINLYNENHLVLDEYAIGEIAGTAFGCIIMYCILYRFWPKKK